MAKYRKKPVVIEAIIWDGDASTANDFLGESYGSDWEYEQGTENIIIPTLEGKMTGQKGDYIIKGVKGEFYPCKPDIFEATYDLVPLSRLPYTTDFDSYIPITGRQ